MDRRLTPFNGRVAHVSLQGRVAADQFVQGTPAVVTQPVTDILPTPDVNGTRMDRQLLLGERVTVVDHDKGHDFVMSAKDGYVGWIVPWSANDKALAAPTHTVCVRATHFYRHRDMKQSRYAWGYSLGSRVIVTDDDGFLAQLRVPCSTDAEQSDDGYRTCFAPSAHLCPVDQPETDPVAVAERLIHTPYLWGGNSAFGIDCSGLVQIACRACGIACPGDSDLQEATLGETLPDGVAAQRGDLLFWKGHVAWVSDVATILHANAHHMAVAFEPMDVAIARIAAQNGGPVTRRVRLSF